MELLRRLAPAALLCATCFSPVETDGTLHCGPQDACPDGFRCVAGYCTRADAAPTDAPAPDAMLPACSNGIDDDCDGKIDMDDPGCSSPNDNNEHGTKKCDDGIDNDLDGFADFHVAGCGPPGDPQCTSPDDDDEK
jgi:hypothetical protein